jgi:hypothetical protein
MREPLIDVRFRGKTDALCISGDKGRQVHVVFKS